jgi:TRAP-type uncharacterized transport system substrate-binding protein
LRIVLTAFAVALGAIALVLGAGYFATLSTTLKVAVPSHDTASKRLFDTAAEAFRTQRQAIRLTVVTTPDSAAALAALDKGTVDLAVGRADDVLRTRSQTALIIRQEAAVIMAPKTGKVKKFADVVGVNLGIVREGPASTGSFTALMDYYGLQPSKLRPVLLSPGEIGPALREKRIEALIVVGDPTSKRVADAVAEANRAVRGGITFLEIEAAEAISRRVPSLEAAEFKQGIFGGAPPLPTESVTSIGSSIRLVASDRLSDERVSDLLRQLLTARQSIGAVVPGAGLIKLPSTDADDANAFVIHPGVLSYGDGEIKTFFDRYGDWLYMGLFLLSGVGSAFAALLGRINAERRRRVMSRVFEIEELLDRATAAGSAEELAEIEHRADEIFRAELRLAVDGELDEAGIKTFELALFEVRHRIAQRRAALAEAAATEAATRTEKPPEAASAEPAGQPGQLIAFSPAGSAGQAS